MTYSQRDPMYYTSDNLNQTGTNKLLNAKIGFQKLIANRLNFDFYVAANNITGNQNYAMVFSNQLPDAYLPAPKEINYFGGLSVKYIFR
jgi:iron complex outermembrane receptor protein